MFRSLYITAGSITRVSSRKTTDFQANRMALSIPATNADAVLHTSGASSCDGMAR